MFDFEIPKYLCKQLQNFFPMPQIYEQDLKIIESVYSDVYEDFICQSKKNRIFRADPELDPFHIMKYPIFIYKLSRYIYINIQNDQFKLKERLHALNKYLHGCSIFYRIKLPSLFFLNYASGVVLGDANYSERLVVYQGVTVGTIDNISKPIIKEKVILMPNCIISGSTIIGSNCIVSAGVRVINKIVPDDQVVFEGSDGNLIFVPNTKNYINKYFI